MKLGDAADDLEADAKPAGALVGPLVDPSRRADAV